MNPDKRKIVFIIITTAIAIFIVVYALKISESEAEGEHVNQPKIPELSNVPGAYKSRKEAVDNIKEERAKQIPAMYDESLLNEVGQYDPYLGEKQKTILMDSILNLGPDLEDYGLANHHMLEEPDKTSIGVVKDSGSAKIQDLFSDSNDRFFIIKREELSEKNFTSIKVNARVLGDQIVKKNSRLELQLAEDLTYENHTLPANTTLYANCTFKPNRLLLEILPFSDMKLRLTAWDISDGREGIYIENSFQSQLTTEVIEDVIQDINIQGVPQVRSIKGIFQRDNLNTKVKVLHQYQLLLKQSL